MEIRNDYALIIGVKDYASYDRAADLAPGTHQVLGALNDARAHYGFCLGRGFAPERIRVLTSPALSAAEMDAPSELASKSTYGEATRAGMLEGIAWLSQSIGGPVPSSGLLTFSGHGDEGTDGRGPLLCPSDVTPSLEEVIDLPALLGKAPASFRDNLTVLLDCCFSAAVGPSAGASLRARVRTSGKGVKAPGPQRTRILAACQQDQQSVSSHFVGRPLGAFTWAVTSVIGQWKAVVEDGVARLDLSYGELLERTRSLLSVLSFAQVPSFSGSETVAKLPFLRPGEKLQAGETSAAPDAPRAKRQLPGGCVADGSVKYRVYTFTLNQPVSTDPSATLAHVLLPCVSVSSDPSGTTYTPEYEYWFVDQTVVQGIETPMQYDSLTISYQDYPITTFQPLSNETLQTTGAAAVWTTKPGGVGASNVFYSGTTKDNTIGIQFDWNTTNGTITSIKWLNDTNGDLVFPTNTMTLNYSSGPEHALYKYKVKNMGT